MVKKFISSKHVRTQMGQMTPIQFVERICTFEFQNDQQVMLLSIAPTLTEKRFKKTTSGENYVSYEGDDPDYKVSIQMERGSIIGFQLHRVDLGAMIQYS